METEPKSVVQLIDLRRHPRQTIPATLHRDLDASEIQAIERQWQPHRVTGEWEHAHWDWNQKSDSLREGWHRAIGVECLETMQGLMAIRKQPCESRLSSSGELLIYIEFIETAPWNLRPSTDAPQFGGVGTVLVRDAVWISRQAGLEGRIGLHSLPQSEAFYRTALGMTDLGPDPAYSQLRYFEYNSIDAHRFLET